MTIDWTKPLQITYSDKPATYGIIGGVRIVAWAGGALAVDDDGELLFTEFVAGSLKYQGYRLVKNEETKDTILLLQKTCGGWVTWTQYPQTNSAAEADIKHHSDATFVKVKVPVQS